MLLWRKLLKNAYLHNQCEMADDFVAGYLSGWSVFGDSLWLIRARDKVRRWCWSVGCRWIVFQTASSGSARIRNSVHHRTTWYHRVSAVSAGWPSPTCSRRILGRTRVSPRMPESQSARRWTLLSLVGEDLLYEWLTDLNKNNNLRLYEMFYYGAQTWYSVMIATKDSERYYTNFRYPLLNKFWCCLLTLILNKAQLYVLVSMSAAFLQSSGSGERQGEVRDGRERMAQLAKTQETASRGVWCERELCEGVLCCKLSVKNCIKCVLMM